MQIIFMLTKFVDFYEYKQYDRGLDIINRQLY